MTYYIFLKVKYLNPSTITTRHSHPRRKRYSGRSVFKMANMEILHIISKRYPTNLCINLMIYMIKALPLLKDRNINLMVPNKTCKAIMSYITTPII